MSLSSEIAAPVEADARAPQRVRHQPRRRELDVLRVEKIAAHMIRVTLGGDLDGFTSLGFDDHVKLFFPELDAPPGADGERPMASRDYTPRRYDPVANSLEIEFVLHDAGPATRWAEQAAPGQTLRIGGPRSSFIIPTEFDWHLLMGDETALPAHHPDMGSSQRRRSRHDGCPGTRAGDGKPAGRRLLRLGRLRVADRQGAARAAHRRPRRQS